MIAPAAHAKTEVEEWPVEWLGSENVFLIRVGDESIVGCPHGDVEVDKVPPEGRFVQFGVTRGHYNGISRYATTLVIFFYFFFLKKKKENTYIVRSSETRRSSTCANPLGCSPLYTRLLPV